MFLKKILNIIVRLFLLPHLVKFKKCGRLFIKSNQSIIGHKYITLSNSFIAGRSLRLHAIDRFRGQQFTPSIIIGDNFTCNDFVSIHAINKIMIGNNVMFASKIYISDHNHGCYSSNCHEEQSRPDEPPALRKLTSCGGVDIGDNVWIGEFVSVLPGTTIGYGSVVGSNSVVMGVVPPNSIVVGNPAKVIKQYDYKDNLWKRDGY